MSLISTFGFYYIYYVYIVKVNKPISNEHEGA